MLRRPSSLAIAVGDPGSWSGLTKLASSTPAPPSSACLSLVQGRSCRSILDMPAAAVLESSVPDQSPKRWRITTAAERRSSRLPTQSCADRGTGGHRCSASGEGLFRCNGLWSDLVGGHDPQLTDGGVAGAGGELRRAVGDVFRRGPPGPLLGGGA